MSGIALPEGLPLHLFYDLPSVSAPPAAMNVSALSGALLTPAAVLRETLAKGGKACHPLVAANGLSRAFVDPALRFLQKRGAQIRFERRLRGIGFAQDRASSLARHCPD